MLLFFSEFSIIIFLQSAIKIMRTGRSVCRHLRSEISVNEKKKLQKCATMKRIKILPSINQQSSASI